jgi:hypothetical protein
MNRSLFHLTTPKGPQLSSVNGTRIGIAGELEFMKYAILGANQLLEGGKPYADDEGRDFEFHLKDEFDRSIAVQVKVRTSGRRPNGRLAERLDIWFLTEEKPPARTNYWYLFACLDSRSMCFRDPVFLVPSAVVARFASRQPNGKFKVECSLSLAWNSTDQFASYRLRAVDIADRLVDVLRRGRQHGSRRKRQWAA